MEEHWCSICHLEGGEQKRWESSELGRRETGGSELRRWKRWGDSEVAMSERREVSEATRWER